jgi:hypothetical protein
MGTEIFFGKSEIRLDTARIKGNSLQELNLKGVQSSGTGGGDFAVAGRGGGY